MISILKQIKRGAYAIVIDFDKDKNLQSTQLHYNPIKRKFFLSVDARGVQRRSITTKQAAKRVLDTIFIKTKIQIYASNGSSLREENQNTILPSELFNMDEHC